MIKKFINKLLGRSASAVSDASPPAVPVGKRVEVSKAEHRIDKSLVDDHALRVVQALSDAGHEAYIVGGAVRDLLLGLRPKDFDVATDATPEQVKGLFRRAFIIGRRFRIVHVVFGRGRENEVIEVSTFRAYLDAAAADQVAGNEKNSKEQMSGKTHVVDAAGRVLRDNVWGPQIEDAARRDFTINAMYYDPQREIVVDYHGGMRDSKARLLRMIGDPVTRYREDPVRIIRVVRFAAKLGFEIEPKTRSPIKELSALLANVPPSRLFDEMIKLLQTGHSIASLAELRKQGLNRGVFPLIDVVLDETRGHDGREKFMQRALSDTDARVEAGKPVAPSYLLACMLWHDVQSGWNELKASGEAPTPALQAAIDAVFDARIGDVSGRGKLAGDMREIWMMQPRFDKRVGNGPYSLVQLPRFRAGLDFLRLREHVGEAAELWVWWDEFALAGDERREELMALAREQESVKRTSGGAARPARPRKPRTTARSTPSSSESSTSDSDQERQPDDVSESAAASGVGEVAVRGRRRGPRAAARSTEASAELSAPALAEGQTGHGSPEADADNLDDRIDAGASDADDDDGDVDSQPARKKRRRRRKPVSREGGEGGGEASEKSAGQPSGDATGETGKSTSGSNVEPGARTPAGRAQD